MSEFRQHKGAVMWSLALHVAAAVVVAIGVPWSTERPRVAVATAPIQGTIVDQAAIERERKAREEVARQQRQREQREERQRREVAEQQRQQEQREQQRVAAEQRAREQAEQEVRDRAAAEQRREQQAQAEREKLAREQREREAQAQREREAAEKRASEQAEQQRRQRQAESELQAQLAAEAEANAARAAGLLEQYIRMIENRIKQNWDRPLSARPGIDCVVNVVQLPTGDVMSAQVASCNGDDAVRRSIERAVMEASPLPKPPNPALFQRNLRVNFKPDE
jgi:colicin import membrane protein